MYIRNNRASRIADKSDELGFRSDSPCEKTHSLPTSASRPIGRGGALVVSDGASWLQWVNYAIQPQVLPRMMGLSLYRLDINFRESAVVGIVGAGGIGAHLLTSVQRYEYATTATILFSIIAIVISLEYTSGYFRKWVQ